MKNSKNITTLCEKKKKFEEITAQHKELEQNLKRIREPRKQKSALVL
jgi:hypothetical protein